MHQYRGLVPLRCKVFARLHNCPNGDEADASFVQTQKKRKVTIAQCLRTLNTKLTSVLAERVIHHGLVMDERSSGQNQ